MDMRIRKNRIYQYADCAHVENICAYAENRNLGRIARILNVNMGEGEEAGGEEGTNRRRRGLGKLFADSDEEESDVEQSGKGLSEANVVAVS